MTTIRATRELWSVVQWMVRQAAVTCVDVMSTIQVVTANSLSIRRAPRRGGDHQSVVRATVRRIEDLIRVVTRRQDNAVAGYVPVQLGGIFDEIHVRFTVKNLTACLQHV